MSRSQATILTNMCLIEDGRGNIVMQIRDPKRYSWSGAALPGGHVEAHEGLPHAVGSAPSPHEMVEQRHPPHQIHDRHREASVVRIGHVVLVAVLVHGAEDASHEAVPSIQNGDVVAEHGLAGLVGHPELHGIRIDERLVVQLALVVHHHPLEGPVYGHEHVPIQLGIAVNRITERSFGGHGFHRGLHSDLRQSLHIRLPVGLDPADGHDGLDLRHVYDLPQVGEVGEPAQILEDGHPQSGGVGHDAGLPAIGVELGIDRLGLLQRLGDPAFGAGHEHTGRVEGAGALPGPRPSAREVQLDLEPVARI